MESTVTCCSHTPVSRRKFLSTTLLSTAFAPAIVSAQQNQLPPYTARDWSGNTPLHYPDPDIHALDPRFRKYILFNTPIRRHYSGTLWAEGPAWNGSGRFLVWSDIPNKIVFPNTSEAPVASGQGFPSNNLNGIVESGALDNFLRIFYDLFVH